jgi:hypothetical protein
MMEIYSKKLQNFSVDLFPKIHCKMFITAVFSDECRNSTVSCRQIYLIIIIAGLLFVCTGTSMYEGRLKSNAHMLVQCERNDLQKRAR